MEHAEAALRNNQSVRQIETLRMRWVGHRLHLEGRVRVDPDLEFARTHEIRRQINRDLVRKIPHMAEISVAFAPDLAVNGQSHTHGQSS